MSPDINEEASFDHVLQHWNVPSVGIDIADNQCVTFGLGLNLEQNGPKKLVRLPSIGRVLAATGMAVEVVYMYASRPLPRADKVMLRSTPLDLIGKLIGKRHNEVKAHSWTSQGTNPPCELVQVRVGESPLK